MNKKILITILTILGLAIIASGFYLWSQKKAEVTQNNVEKQIIEKNIEKQKQEREEGKGNIAKNNKNQNEQNQESIIKPPNTEDWRTAKWITYRDKKNGFEVEYPDSHFVDKKFRKNENIYIRHADTVRYRKSRVGQHDIPETNLIEISVRENKKELSLIKWLQENNKRCRDCVENSSNSNCKFGCDFNEIKIIDINGKDALLLSEPSIMDNSAVYFNLRNKVIEFHAQGISYDSNNGDNFFKKMMESFKAIN